MTVVSQGSAPLTAEEMRAVERVLVPFFERVDWMYAACRLIERNQGRFDAALKHPEVERVIGLWDLERLRGNIDDLRRHALIHQEIGLSVAIQVRPDLSREPNPFLEAPSIVSVRYDDQCIEVRLPIESKDAQSQGSIAALQTILRRWSRPNWGESGGRRSFSRVEDLLAAVQAQISPSQVLRLHPLSGETSALMPRPPNEPVEVDDRDPQRVVSQFISHLGSLPGLVRDLMKQSARALANTGPAWTDGLEGQFDAACSLHLRLRAECCAAHLRQMLRLPVTFGYSYDDTEHDYLVDLSFAGQSHTFREYAFDENRADAEVEALLEIGGVLADPGCALADLRRRVAQGLAQDSDLAPLRRSIGSMLVRGQGLFAGMPEGVERLIEPAVLPVFRPAAPGASPVMQPP